MYKIMTKLHTSRENVFGFHMVTNDNEEVVEYKVKTKEEAAETALELLGRVGYDDLRIVDDQSYYLDLIYGRKPAPEENLYNLTIVGPYVFHATLEYEDTEIPDVEPVDPEDPSNFDTTAYSMGEGNSIGEVIDEEPIPEENKLVVENIKENETVSVRVLFDIPVQSFHLVINNKEYKTGLPKWIAYEEQSRTTGILTFHGITRDYFIEVIIDDDTFVEPVEPEVDGGTAILKFDESIIDISKVVSIRDTEYQYHSIGEEELSIELLENGVYTIDVWAEDYNTATYEAIIGKGNVNEFVVKLLKVNSGEEITPPEEIEDENEELVDFDKVDGMYRI